MRRAFRRIITTGFIVAAILLVGLVAAVLLLRAPPAFYRPPALTPQQAESAAKRVEDKLVEIRNVATDRATPVGAFVVTFTQDELNAFLAKWGELSQVRGVLGGRAERPMVVLRRGELVLAATVEAAGLRTVVAAHLRPVLSDDGLRLNATAFSAGRLPIPAGQVLTRLRPVVEPVRRRLPDWQREARLGSGGQANEDAVKAAYARLLLATVDGGASVPPVLLIPVDARRALPMRLTEIALVDGSVTLRARPLTAVEQLDFARSLKP